MRTPKVRVRLGNTLYEGSRIGVVLMPEDVVSRALFDDAPQIHDCDPVADMADHRQVVGDDEISQSMFGLEIGHQVQDLALNRHIEPAVGSSAIIRRGLSASARATPTRRA